MHDTYKYKHNQLETFRRRRRLGPTDIARLLGHRDAKRYSKFERSARAPSLIDAFRLGIILRVPVEFLFPELYNELRLQIREQEENTRHKPADAAQRSPLTESHS